MGGGGAACVGRRRDREGAEFFIKKINIFSKRNSHFIPLNIYILDVVNLC